MEALYEIVYRYVLLQICNSSYMDREVCGGLDPDGTVDSVVVGLFFIYAGFYYRVQNVASDQVSILGADADIRK